MISLLKSHEDYLIAGELCPGKSLNQEQSQCGNIARVL